MVHNGGRSRAFSVSVKDRGAILPGGHAGKAFWFSKSSGHFVTSTYYYDDYPEWVKLWNAANPADAYKGKAWELLRDRSTYIHGQMDDRPYEADLKPLGRVFPHSLGKDSKYFYLLLTLTPIGDMLTLDFAKALIQNEKLGQNENGAPDYLQISFSSTDYVGHLFGPSSLETEDNLLRLESIAAIHGSPWTYDTFVPIFFAGHGITAQVIRRRVAPTDIAATITTYLGVKPPSGSVGQPLWEIWGQ